MSELLPCPNPWCPDKRGRHIIWNLYKRHVHCIDCQVMGPGGKDDAEAIAAWNTRAALQPTSDHAELRTYMRNVSKAFMRVSGGGSEMTTTVAGDYYADPEACANRVQEKLNAAHNRIQTLVQENARLREALEQIANRMDRTVLEYQPNSTGWFEMKEWAQEARQALETNNARD